MVCELWVGEGEGCVEEVREGHCEYVCGVTKNGGKRERRGVVTKVREREVKDSGGMGSK